jgi:hypothetical protein
MVDQQSGHLGSGITFVSRTRRRQLATGDTGRQYDTAGNAFTCSHRRRRENQRHTASYMYGLLSN